MIITGQRERSAERPGPDAGPAQDRPHQIKYRRDTSHYVAAMLTELRQIADKAGFERLVTALDAAYYEAYTAMDSHARPHAERVREKVSPAMEQTDPQPR